MRSMSRSFVILTLIILSSGCTGSRKSDVKLIGHISGYGEIPEVLLLDATESKSYIESGISELNSWWVDTLLIDTSGNFIHSYYESQGVIIIPWLPEFKAKPEHTHPPFIGLLINKQFLYTFTNRDQLSQTNLYVNDLSLGSVHKESSNSHVEYIPIENSDINNPDWIVNISIEK